MDKDRLRARREALLLVGMLLLAVALPAGWLWPAGAVGASGVLRLVLPAVGTAVLAALAYFHLRARSLADARRDAELRFRALFDLSPVGMCLTDCASGRFLEVNDALLGPTGYTRAQLLGLRYDDVATATGADAAAARLQALQQHGRHDTLEYGLRRCDGTTFPALVSGILAQHDGRDVVWSIVQDITLRKSMERELQAAASRDRLTGLANRSAFLDRLRLAMDRVRRGEQRLFAVLFLDFDRFKVVNDAMGHEAGDRLLAEIAKRLRTALRRSDDDGASENLIARFGGDEFLVLVNDLKDPADAGAIADRLLAALAPAYVINGRDVHSTASIGIVTSQQCMETPEAVVRNADVAMYEAKRAGRGCYVVFDEAMLQRLTRHLTIESSLRQALGTSQLSLVYQPIVDLASGRAVSVEALMRWHHPVLGQVSPAEFIPVAEESGLIVALGQWALRQACRDFAAWRAQDPAHAPASVSVNISRAELALGPQLLAKVRLALEDFHLPPSCLQLEVTEREVMREPEETRRLMNELRQLGVRIAMDDFGTGTSSLGCLRDYPFDVIKIDRTFVRDIATRPDMLAVLHATVTLVSNLGKLSVAEGVEDAAQVGVLQSVGCRMAQGYHFCRPVPAEGLLGAVQPQHERSAATCGAAAQAVDA